MYFFVVAVWLWNMYLCRLVYLRMFDPTDTKTFDEPD